MTVGERGGEVDGMGAGEDLNLVVKKKRNSRVGGEFTDISGRRLRGSGWLPMATP